MDCGWPSRWAYYRGCHIEPSQVHKHGCYGHRPLQVRKQRPRVVESPAQGHTAVRSRAGPCIPRLFGPRALVCSPEPPTSILDVPVSPRLKLCILRIDGGPGARSRLFIISEPPGNLAKTRFPPTLQMEKLNRAVGGLKVTQLISRAGVRTQVLFCFSQSPPFILLSKLNSYLQLMIHCVYTGA